MVSSDAYAYSTVEWNDTVFIGGNLPFGTPVDLMLTAGLDSTLNGTANSPLLASFSSVLCGYATSVCSTSASVVNHGTNNGVRSQSVLVDTYAGAELSLVSDLAVTAEAALGGPGSAFATADASNTANTYISVLTPGATYTTASGLTYSPSSVPEPRTALLLAALLPIIWLDARRRHNSR